LSELPIPPARQRTSRELIEEFFRLEAAGGIVLVIAAIVALLWANTPWRELHAALLHIPVVVQFGALRLDKPLLLGKQLSVFGITWIAVQLGIGQKPAGASWLQLYGMSVLTGIGFTMSLFIGTLAFEAPEYNVAVRLGVLCASVACGAAGYLVLYLAPRR
jgi:NhaA family Na+:H+ antiporter